MRSAPGSTRCPRQRLATGEDSTCSADAAPDHERPVATNAVRHGGEHEDHCLMIMPAAAPLALVVTVGAFAPCDPGHWVVSGRAASREL